MFLAEFKKLLASKVARTSGDFEASGCRSLACDGIYNQIDVMIDSQNPFLTAKHGLYACL